MATVEGAQVSLNPGGGTAMPLADVANRLRKVGQGDGDNMQVTHLREGRRDIVKVEDMSLREDL